jgi:hypothetical protein
MELIYYTSKFTFNINTKERIRKGLPILLTCAASFGCPLVFAANLCCQLGMLALAGFEPRLLLYSKVLVFIFPVLEMNNS